MFTRVKAWFRVRTGWLVTIAVGVLGFIGIKALIVALSHRKNAAGPGPAMSKAEGQAAHAAVDATLQEEVERSDAFWDEQDRLVREAMERERK